MEYQARYIHVVYLPSFPVKWNRNRRSRIVLIMILLKRSRTVARSKLFHFWESNRRWLKYGDPNYHKPSVTKYNSCLDIRVYCHCTLTNTQTLPRPFKATSWPPRARDHLIQLELERKKEEKRKHLLFTKRIHVARLFLQLIFHQSFSNLAVSANQIFF